MLSQLLLAAGLLGGLLSGASYFVLAYDVKVKGASANWASWISSFALASLALFNQLQLRAGWAWSFVIILAQVGGTLTMMMLAIQRHRQTESGRFEPFDVLMFIGFLVALSLQFGVQKPGLALGLIVLADGLGMLPSIRDAYKKPTETHNRAWIMDTCAGLLSALAVGAWRLELLAYPLYLSAISLAVLGGKWLGQPASIENRQP